MKRHNEGYVLVYVMVAVVLLCALGAAVCSIALRNYQSQQASVERMQQLYEAEGMIEQFVAQAQAVSLSGDGGQETAKTAFETEIESLMPSITENAEWGTESENNVLFATLTAVSGDVSVNAVVKITAEINERDENDDPNDERWVYTVTVTSVTYDSYEIGGVEQGEGSGAE